jgi:hypothetical protein
MERTQLENIKYAVSGVFFTLILLATGILIGSTKLRRSPALNPQQPNIYYSLSI